VCQTLPRASGQSVGTFQTRNPRFDSGPEITQTPIQHSPASPASPSATLDTASLAYPRRAHTISPSLASSPLAGDSHSKDSPLPLTRAIAQAYPPSPAHHPTTNCYHWAHGWGRRSPYCQCVHDAPVRIVPLAHCPSIAQRYAPTSARVSLRPLVATQTSLDCADSLGGRTLGSSTSPAGETTTPRGSVDGAI